MHTIEELTSRGVLAMIASHIADTHGVENVRVDDEANDGTYLRLYFLRRFSTPLYEYQANILNQVAAATGNPSKATCIGRWEYGLGLTISEQNLVILNPYTKPSVDDKYNICDPAFDISAVYESCEEHVTEHYRQMRNQSP